jgi:hypothetical protein
VSLPSLPVHDLVRWKREAEVCISAEFYIHSVSVFGLVRERSDCSVESRLRMRNPLRHFPLYTSVKQSKREVSQLTVKSYAGM